MYNTVVYEKYTNGRLNHYTFRQMTLHDILLNANKLFRTFYSGENDVCGVSLSLGLWLKGIDKRSVFKMAAVLQDFSNENETTRHL